MKETPDENEMEEKESDNSGSVKVPEAFQKEATALVEGCATMPCLEFLSSLVSDQRQKLMSSQKKAHLNTANFSMEDMPQ